MSILGSKEVARPYQNLLKVDREKIGKGLCFEIINKNLKGPPAQNNHPQKPNLTSGISIALIWVKNFNDFFP